MFQGFRFPTHGIVVQSATGQQTDEFQVVNDRLLIVQLHHQLTAIDEDRLGSRTTHSHRQPSTVSPRWQLHFRFRLTMVRSCASDSPCERVSLAMRGARTWEDVEYDRRFPGQQVAASVIGGQVDFMRRHVRLVTLHFRVRLQAA